MRTIYSLQKEVKRHALLLEPYTTKDLSTLTKTISELNTLISYIKNYLIIEDKDTEKVIRVITKGKNCTSERQYINILKEENIKDNLKPFYKLIVKAISTYKELISLRDTLYIPTYINMKEGEKLLELIDKRITNNFPEKDELLNKVYSYIYTSINNTKI